MPKHPIKSSRKSRPARTPSPLTPSTVLALFRDAARPLKWPQIRGASKVHRGPEADRLRGLLRGLCHSGELFIDSVGAYHLSDSQGNVTGELERRERGAFALRCDAGGEVWPVRLTRRTRLRPGDRVEARIVEDQAVVVEVTQRCERPLVGRLVAGQRGWYVLSDSPDFRGRVVLAPDGFGDAGDGDSVAVRVVGEDSYGLIGEVIEVIAARDDLHVASTTLLAAYDVPTQWPDDVAGALRVLPDQVIAEDFGAREDLCGLPLVTIDGETAKDFDDAVYCEARPRGGWRLIVAIADVAEYVGPGDPLDRVGLERGNSVYLPDRVVPMLPEALSNDLCSLRPEVHRLALVCDMQVSATGRVSKFRFYEGLIQSWARLTYTRVAGFISGDREGMGAEIAASLNAMHAVFRCLRTEREARGALDFETRELNLILENGLLERIEPVERNAAHMLIEEAMIAANVCAARFLESNERAGLYRVHEGPTGEKFDALREGLAAAGIRLSNRKPTPKDLMQILAGLGDRPDRALLETLILRSMTQAIYTPSNAGHFGLALSRYMHFTSPIRRYADLVVHRAIKSILCRDGQPDRSDLGEVGTHISLTERRAEEVSRAVEDWLKCEYAVQWVGQTFSGRVIGVTDFGLFIELEDVFIQGLLHVSNLGNDYFHLNGPGTSLIGERSGRHFDMGAELEVVLADVDVEARKIDLLLPGARHRGRDKRRSRR